MPRRGLNDPEGKHRNKGVLGIQRKPPLDRKARSPRPEREASGDKPLLRWRQGDSSLLPSPQAHQKRITTQETESSRNSDSVVNKGKRDSRTDALSAAVETRS